MSVFCKIPEEMLEQILSSLPPKSLMRFKCVSKGWYALINNPEFVAKHLSNSMHNNLSTCVILKRSVLKDTQDTKDTKTREIELVFSLLNFFNGNNDGEPGFLSGVNDMKIPLSMSQKTRGDPDSLRNVGYWARDEDINSFFPASSVPEYGISVKTRGDLLQIIGHCNGIICLAYPSELLAYPSHVFLWNPAIHEFKLLPPEPYLENWPNALSPDTPDYLATHRFSNALGFGYDSKSKDYKVVNIGSDGSYPGDNQQIIHPPKAVAYTLRTDSWKEIKTDSLQTETTNLWPAYFELYFNGRCYWLGHEQHKEGDLFDLFYEEFIRDVIISFDMGNEVFQEILLPDGLGKIHVNSMHLLVWNKSIALYGHDLVGSFGIWVMDEFGGARGARGAWTKHHTLELIEWSLVLEWPLVFLKSDEILMVQDSDGSILSYNLNTEMRTYLPIQSVPPHFAKAIVYVNSIVSVKGGNNIEG